MTICNKLINTAYSHCTIHWLWPWTQTNTFGHSFSWCAASKELQLWRSHLQYGASAWTEVTHILNQQEARSLKLARCSTPPCSHLHYIPHKHREISRVRTVAIPSSKCTLAILQVVLAYWYKCHQKSTDNNCWVNLAFTGKWSNGDTLCQLTSIPWQLIPRARSLQEDTPLNNQGYQQHSMRDR